MKRTSIYTGVIIGILGLLVHTAAVLGAAKQEIKLPKVEGIVGEILSVPVEVAKFPGKSIQGYSFTLAYDSDIVDITGSSTSGTISEDATLEENTSSSGEYSVEVTGDGAISGKGTLLLLEVSLKAEGKSKLSFSEFDVDGGPKFDRKDGHVKVKAEDKKDDDNKEPKFTSKPVTEVVAGQQYSYTATASDPDGDDLSFTLDDHPDWLELTDHGDGSATLQGTPPEPHEDDDLWDDWDDDEDDEDDEETVEVEVELEVTDGEDDDEQEFDIEILPPENDSETNDSETSENDSPTASNDWASTHEGSSLTIDVLANDSDPDGDPLEITDVSAPEHGTAHISQDDKIVYSPEASYTGNDSFTYTIEDAHGATDQAEVNMSIEPDDSDEEKSEGSDANEEEEEEESEDSGTDDSNEGQNGNSGSGSETNRAPTAQSDAGSTLEDTAIRLNILENDSDPDGDEISVTDISSAAHGSVELHSTGAVTYTPENDFFGDDSFSYQIDDNHGNSDEASVELSIEPVNDPPEFTAGGDVEVEPGNETHSIENWASDIDPGAFNEEQQELSFEVSANPSDLFAENPSIDVESGDLRFVPAAGEHGTANVTVRLHDDGGTENGGSDVSESVTFEIHVAVPNRSPEFTTDPVTGVKANKRYQYTAATVDPDDDGLTITAREVPDWLGFSDNGDGTGSLEGTPNETHVGSHDVSLRATDGTHTVDQSFSITVTKGNSPPRISSIDDRRTTLDTPIEITEVEVYDEEENIDNLTITISSTDESVLSDENIKFRSQGDSHRLTLELIPGEPGSTTVTVTVSDGELESQTSFRVLVESGREVPESYRLRQNYPNPFNPQTTIEYGVPDQTHVRLAIYDVTGKQITVLVDETKTAGWHETIWDARGNRSGPYFYQLQTDEAVKTEKLLLLK